MSRQILTQSEMEDFRGGGGAEWEPVSCAVADDGGLAGGFAVEAGPVAIHERPHAEFRVEHEGNADITNKLDPAMVRALLEDWAQPESDRRACEVTRLASARGDEETLPHE